MGLLNPAAWNGIGIVSFLIVATGIFVWLLLSGRIVLGIHHRELMAQKDREIEHVEGRSKEDAVSIAKFADASTAQVVSAEMQAAFVRAMRELAEERRP